jgi:hypothetical protein
VDAELSRRIRRGGDDAALIGASADDYGLAFQRWVVELFHGDEKRVHVDMEEGSHSRLPGISILRQCRGGRLRREFSNTE